MKIRTDFVTNSSSSSFVCIKKLESTKLEELFQTVGLDMVDFIEFFNTCEDDVELAETAAETICRLCFLQIRYSMYDVSTLDCDEITEYFDEELWNFDDVDYIKCASDVLNLLEQLDIEEDEEDAEIINQAQKLCRLIPLIMHHKNIINHDITMDITTERVVTDSGCPDFFYDCLKVDKGVGEYISFNADDCLEDESELKKWAIEKGYYDEDLDDYDSDFICEPPFEEICASYPGVYRTNITPEKVDEK